MKGQPTLLLLLASVQSFIFLGNAFSPSLGPRRVSHSAQQRSNEVVLSLAKKRRRRKEPPAADTSAPPPTVEKVAEPPILEKAVEPGADIDDEEEVDISQLMDIAKFSFDGQSEQEMQSDETVPIDSADNALPLPDIKQALRRKAMEEELARVEEEKESTKVKIKRTDRVAMARLLEQQPYADADDSLFEEEEYGTVSALLGERAKDFIGLPSGPLQIGHFIGALVIVLMAFVEYPGFPLTNLPTPIRGALQGGLGTVYAINFVLAVLSVFKAGERGQPAFLWVAKTFSVGGLAYDQLTQLPTLEEIEKAKARKGARALKKKKY